MGVYILMVVRLLRMDSDEHLLLGVFDASLICILKASGGVGWVGHYCD